MLFTRRLETFLTIIKLFYTQLKKMENILVIAQYRTWNLYFLKSLLYHYTTRLTKHISQNLIIKKQKVTFMDIYDGAAPANK